MLELNSSSSSTISGILRAKCIPVCSINCIPDTTWRAMLFSVYREEGSGDGGSDASRSKPTFCIFIF